LKPSKWPFKILSPIGEGALGGREPGARVFALLALRGVGLDIWGTVAEVVLSRALFSGGVMARGALGGCGI